MYVFHRPPSRLLRNEAHARTHPAGIWHVDSNFCCVQSKSADRTQFSTPDLNENLNGSTNFRELNKYKNCMKTRSFDSLLCVTLPTIHPVQPGTGGGGCSPVRCEVHKATARPDTSQSIVSAAAEDTLHQPHVIAAPNNFCIPATEHCTAVIRTVQ